MLVYSYFNEAEQIDYCLYESSNVLASKCLDLKDSYKELYVVFKNGAMYWYHELSVNDYVMFKHELSNGKALNTYIKKYKCEKVENPDISFVKKLHSKMEKEQKKVGQPLEEPTITKNEEDS